MTKKHICTALNVLMLAGVLLFLLLGLAKAIVQPKALNNYENRTAAQFPTFTPGGWLDGSFQSEVETALGDQAPLAYTMKMNYNSLHNAIQYRAFRTLSAMRPEQMVRYEDYRIYDGKYIAFLPNTWESVESDLTARVKNLNSIVDAHPETEFNLYYIETDIDVTFETGEKTGVYEYLRDHVALPAEQMGVYAVDDLASYEERFFCTDHHWNHIGSYLGYCRLTELLHLGQPLLPEATVKFSDQFSGSKVKLLGSEHLFSEPFYAYRFRFPPMEVTVEGQPDTYGLQAEFPAYISYLTYASFYGSDAGELIFDRGEGENILILGDSFDNAIVRLLAAHFGRTHCVDLRHYEARMGKPFRLGQYLQENQIERVLLIGSSSFFTKDDFLLED